jgi:F0F1-type ATP synthase assembly protein I
MTKSRPPLSGRDAAGAGALLLAVNLICAGVGAGLGALLDAVVPLLLIGFFVGFFLGIYVVAKRFRDL